MLEDKGWLGMEERADEPGQIIKIRNDGDSGTKHTENSARL